MKTKYCLCFGFMVLHNVNAAQAAELVLRPAEILDLARAPQGERSFEFDKVTLGDRSVILIPASFKKLKLTINHLQSTGTSYIAVYDDEVAPQLQVPLKPPRAGLCTPGSAGSVGLNGGQRHKVQINLVVGFSTVDRLVVVAEGLQGVPGGNGGDGQDGGDSGGAERCVVNSCNGGNGGANGLGGIGGPGGDGGEVTLDFSGLSKDAIHSYPDGSNYLAALTASLSAGPDIQEKIISEYSNDARGFHILMSGTAQVKTLAGRGPPPTSDAVEYRPGVNIVVAPGGGGRPGPNGSWTGSGGAGYSCTLGKNQDGGKGGLPIFMPNATGTPGKPGKVIINKLD